MTRKEEVTRLIYKEESYAIISACFAVYKVVEIKAVSALVDEHRAQVLNYLSATGCELALLVNLGHYPRLEYERLLPRKLEPANLHL